MARNGGLISKNDLAAYQAKVRAPIRGTYRGYDMITMPPPSSGGVTMVEMLNILERFDLREAGRHVARTRCTRDRSDAPRLSRSRALPRRSGLREDAARAAHVQDLREDARGVDRSVTHASSSVELGQGHRDAGRVATEDDETTQFSIVDSTGNAVSNTFTLEGGFGSHVVVDGAGFILNNEMGDFNKKPGETNLTGDIGTPANLIAPGKRMLSSMSPTIVTKNGKLFMVTGSPGGRTIINTVMEIVLNATDFGHGCAPGGGRAAIPSSVAARHGDVRAERASRFDDAAAAGDGHTRSSSAGRQGDAHTIIVQGWRGLRGERPSERRLEGERALMYFFPQP